MTSPVVEAVRDQTLEELGRPTLRIGGRDCPCGALNIDQIAALAIWSNEAIRKLNPADLGPFLGAAEAASKGKKVDPKLASIDRWANLIMQLIKHAPPRTLFSILLEQPEEWCGKMVSLRDLPAILERLRDENDPALLLPAFRAAVQGWSPRSNDPSSGPPSSS